ncbi:MAG: hypothetical protein M1827_001270 [Pycnora praestabilis]|nr:MAG: hypothetical protein M1827_001270 [Pycnora praestabilis]
MYSKLTSAKKRKSDQETPAKTRRPSAISDSDEAEMIEGPSRNGPFALAKKPSRGPRPKNDPMVLGGQNLGRHLVVLRPRLHQMEFFDFLTYQSIEKSRISNDDKGLPRNFSDVGVAGYPWNIEADAEALYLKWSLGILDPHLLRGIRSEKSTVSSTIKRMSHSLGKDDAARRNCNVSGANDLINGQWWLMQICAVRDGAHGEIEAGIRNQPNEGAFSVVLSRGGYKDKDEGDSILYCGTSGSEAGFSSGTGHLKCIDLKTPVRVLRSSALPKSNRYRPTKGLRYDGPYDVVGYQLLDAKAHMHRFSLKMQEGQGPIRYQGVEARPSAEELAEYLKIRELLELTT